jgi:hypothetical protein
MDLRQIQALHAQYSGQPVVIDITSHAAAMPALPAPEGGKSARSYGAALAKLRTARRPALIGVAIAALAGLGGMSAARVWHAMHEGVHQGRAAVVPAEAHVPTPAQSIDDGTMPVNVAPPKPLTASDFETQKGTGSSGLSKVDARSLAMPAAAPRIDAPAATESASTEQRAAASPIHAQRQAAPAQTVPTVASQAVAQPQPQATTQNASTPAVSRASESRSTPASASVVATPASTATAAAAATEQSHTPAKPVLRPLHHVTRHQPTANDEPTASSTTTPAPSKAPAPKSGDVQLF